MSNPLLSVLIPTVVGRENTFNVLMDKLNPLLRGEQVDGVYLKEHYILYYGDGIGIDFSKDRLPENVEIISLKDNKQVSIGQKREDLYKMANGLFSFMIDDDDDISDNAIELILKAIKENPNVDCITFREKCIMNGEYRSCNHSLKYDCWQDNFDGYSYVRTPFYKDVIKTEIAKSVPFLHIRYNEDEQWSMALKPHLKTEHHIDEEIYYYNYNPKDTHNERYGIES